MNAIALTEKGERKASYATTWPDFLLQATQDLSLAEQKNVLRGLMKIVRSLQENGDIPVTRMCVTCQFFHPNVYEDSDRPHHCAFVDAPGDRHLRLDCPDHETADLDSRQRNWEIFNQGNAS